MARLAAEVADARPIAFSDTLPVAFRGDAGVPSVSLKGTGKPVFDERRAEILSALYAGHPLQPAVDTGLDLRQEVGRAMAEEAEAASRGAITPKGFEFEAQRMARFARPA